MCEACKAYLSIIGVIPDGPPKQFQFPFLCFWDSWDTKVNYHRRDWSVDNYSVGNIKWEPLIDPQKVPMPPLHIKYGLIKQFVMALDKESAAFKYLQDLFAWLPEAKVTTGIFVRPHIKIIV